MTATDELRRMLDERGVEWTYSDGTVSYADSGRWFHAWAYNDGAMCVSMGYLTPEQAIAATLGESHPYGQRITGDGSDWGEIMTDAFDSLMSSASESCTPDEMMALESHIAATLGGGKRTAEQGRIEELERSIEYYRLELVCYESDVDARDALICDMWEDLVGLQGGYKELGYQTSLPEFARRIRELGIEVDRWE